MGSRKANGESSIYFSEADGNWHGWITVGTKPDGRPDRRHRMALTEAVVRQKIKALEKQRATGRVSKPGRPPTIGQWLEIWLDTVCARKVADGSMAPRTLDDYRSKCSLYLIPGIGQHRIDRLTPDHLDSLYLELLRRPLASSTVLKTHRIISRALKVAMQREIVTRNVATLLDAPAAQETEIAPLSRDEVQAVLAEAAERRNGVRWSLALALGLRQGEALGLRWRCVDLEAGLLHINWQLQRLTWRHGCSDPHTCGAKHHRPDCHQDCTKHAKACPDRRGGGLVFRPPKAKNNRTLPIPPPLLPLLRAHRTAQQRERLKAGSLWEDHDLVFCHETGRPIDPRVDYSEWQDILQESGIQAKRVHDGRHTAGTLLIESGVSLRVVMELLGHSQLRVTQRYTHVCSPLAEDAAARMGAVLWGQPAG